MTRANYLVCNFGEESVEWRPLQADERQRILDQWTRIYSSTTAPIIITPSRGAIRETRWSYIWGFRVGYIIARIIFGSVQP